MKPRIISPSKYVEHAKKSLKFGIKIKLDKTLSFSKNSFFNFIDIKWLFKKKAAKISIMSLLLLLILFQVQIVTNVKGEILGPLKFYVANTTRNIVEIISPKNGIYNTNSILLNFTVEADNAIGDVGFSLDDGPVEKITNLTKIGEVPAPELYLPPYIRVTFRGQLLLSNLTSGNHSVTVYQGHQYRGMDDYHDTLHDRYDVKAYSYVNFTVDSVSPRISVLSPQSVTYNVSDVPLNFTVSEAVSKVAYSLDGQENITVTKNTTLANLTYGMHNITINAWDVAGNVGSSETVTFNITQPEIPAPFPVLPVAAVVVVMAACAGLLVYSKAYKRKARTINQ